MKYKAEVRMARRVKTNVLVPYEEYDRIRTEYYKTQKECEHQLDIVRKFLKPIVDTQENPELRNIDMYGLMQRVFNGEFKTKIMFTKNPFDVFKENKMGWYIEFSDFDIRSKNFSDFDIRSK